MWNQAGAIVWAQWRSTRNHLPRANLGGLVFTGVLTAVWYGAFAYLAVLAAILLSQAARTGGVPQNPSRRSAALLSLLAGDSRAAHVHGSVARPAQAAGLSHPESRPVRH
jgi:hypothetical protein